MHSFKYESISNELYKVRIYERLRFWFTQIFCNVCTNSFSVPVFDFHFVYQIKIIGNWILD